MRIHDSVASQSMSSDPYQRLGRSPYWNQDDVHTIAVALVEYLQNQDPNFITLEAVAEKTVDFTNSAKLQTKGIKYDVPGLVHASITRAFEDYYKDRQCPFTS